MGTLRRVAAILCGEETIVQPQLAVNKQCTGNVQIGNHWPTDVQGARVGSLRVIADAFPTWPRSSHQLMGEDFNSQSGTPPIIGIEVGIPRGDDAQNGAGRETFFRKCNAPGACGSST